MSEETTKKWQIASLGKLSMEELKTLIGYKEGEHVPFKGRSLAKVFTLDNRVQGDYLVGILEEEGIPAFWQSDRDTAFDGIYIPSRGFGSIITLEEDAHRARTIIEAVVETIQKEAEVVEPAREDEEEEKNW
jgi:hypothetical protein